MPDISSFEFHLSGGASNANPNASLGGPISSNHLLSMAPALKSGSSAVAGVTIVNAVNMPYSDITFTSVAGKLTVNDGTNSVQITVTANGRYTASLLINRWVVVDVISSALGTGNTTGIYNFSYAKNAIFDDVTSSQSAVGSVEYRCVYFKNNSDLQATNVRFWIASQPSGGDAMQIGIDPAGTGTATTIASESAAPAGVVFSSPADIASAIVSGTLNVGQAFALWIRRTVPAGISVGASNDLSFIRAALDVA